MAWTPPASKWKTQRFSPVGCGNGSTLGVGPDQCVIRERFDALAEPRVITVAGFEQVCADHDDGSVPVGQIQLFTGEWMTFREWHAYEACFYSWVVWHEIDDGNDPDKEQRKAKQAERSLRVADGVTNVHRVDTDDGPWKPLAAITNPSAAQRAAVGTVSGYVKRDSRMVDTVEEEVFARVAIPEGFAWWFTGSGADRVLHVDSGGNLTPPQRNAISAIVDLRYGSGRLVWEG